MCTLPKLKHISPLLEQGFGVQGGGVLLNNVAKSNRRAHRHTKDQGFYFSHIRYKMSIKPKIFLKTTAM